MKKDWKVIDKKEKNTSKPMQGHFKKAGVTPKRFVAEFDGYEGDVKTKMFTSIKYYYMKKNKKEKKEKPEKRKKYISLSHSILETIDNHIMKEINNNMEKNGLINIEPSSAYLNFCKENQSNIVEEIKILKEQMDQNEIATKLKKTYKNRYQNKKLALQNSIA